MPGALLLGHLLASPLMGFQAAWGWGEDPMTRKPQCAVPASSGWEESILRDQTPEKDTLAKCCDTFKCTQRQPTGLLLAPDPRCPSPPTTCAYLVGKVGTAPEARRGSGPSGRGCVSVCVRASVRKAGVGSEKTQSSRAAAYRAEVAVLCSSF